MGVAVGPLEKTRRIVAEDGARFGQRDRHATQEVHGLPRTLSVGIFRKPKVLNLELQIVANDHETEQPR